MKPARRKLRVLIADDHPLVRHGIRALLQAHKEWSIIGEAADGNDALAKIEKLRPDIAILDITMPGLDGLEVTRRLHAAASTAKILVLSMHESEQLVRRLLDVGCRGYVLKSDLAVSLVKAVKSVAQGKVFLTPRVSEVVLQAFRSPEGQSQPQDSLTNREVAVIRLLANRKSNKEVAASLGISIRTAEEYRARIMLKLRCHSPDELTDYAKRHGHLASIEGAQ